jgi:Ca-activated chloride channel homolog
MNWNSWAVEVEHHGHQRVHVLTSADASGQEARAPILVNLLLDRSGSMKGAPLAAAVEAAHGFFELARPDDFIGLLLFDGVVEQRVPVTAMDAKGKQQMEEALAEVKTGRGTALHQAVELGARNLKRLLVPGRRPRLLLLTDGEPSVGPDTQEAFDLLGLKVSKDGIAVHALGLARHYVAEVLQALTLPSGNAFEHVDGPEGLAEAMGGVVAQLFGEVAHTVQLQVSVTQFSALECRHGFATASENESLTVTLGDVSRGLSRKVLLSGTVAAKEWEMSLVGSSNERGDQRHQRIELTRVSEASLAGRYVLSVDHELELVANETAAWLSLARRELERAERQLEAAEAHLRATVALAAEGVPVRRHLERLGDLRLAIERGEGDIPLLIRRAQSARVGTNVSQVIPLNAWRNNRR